MLTAIFCTFVCMVIIFVMNRMKNSAYQTGIEEGVKIAMLVELYRIATTESFTDEERVRFVADFMAFMTDRDKLADAAARATYRILDADLHAEE